jgi:hypothetical protein
MHTSSRVAVVLEALVVSLLVVPVVLAQPRPAAAPSRDGGVPLDAGVAARSPSAADAGASAAPGAPPAGEVERLKREVTELRARVVDLEQRQARASAAADDVERLRKEFDGLKGQVSKLQEADDQRSSAEASAAERRAAMTAAATNLGAVLSQLSSGNTRGIEPSLQYAEATFTGAAQRLVQLARQALAQGDLANARTYLALALAEVNSLQK